VAPSVANRTAIPNLTQFVFARDRRKQNQLNLPPHKTNLRALHGLCATRSAQTRRKATGVWFLEKSNVYKFYLIINHLVLHL